MLELRSDSHGRAIIERQRLQRPRVRAGGSAEPECGSLIKEQGLIQAAAAELLGVAQPRISDLVRGKIARFSVDTLIKMLGHAGERFSGG
jgi:hypothetical protein